MNVQATRRTHLTVPKGLLIELDQRVGVHSRSETIVELVEEFLRRERLVDVIDRFAGSISAADHPEWATEEDIVKWGREVRASWDRNVDA